MIDVANDSRNVLRESNTRDIAWRAVIIFGLISLMGDVIYEGARGILPAYLKILGLSAFLVGFILGVGEFLGYLFRFIGGAIADMKKSYWFFVFIGYGVLLFVPMIGFVSNWQLVLFLVILERAGKGLRSPSRDTLLAIATTSRERGKAFGVHEFFDQIGAVSGPLVVSLVLYLALNNYSLALGVLFIPWLILMAILFFGYVQLRKPIREKISMENEKMLNNVNDPVGGKSRTMSVFFYLYVFSVFFNVAGTFHVSIMLYLAEGLMLAWAIPVFYLTIQLVDAIFAPLSGIMYDKIGRWALVLPFILSIFPTILVVQGSLPLLVLGGIFYGVVLGAQESIYRASVADLTSLGEKATAYGVFSVIQGIGVMIAATLFGYFIGSEAHVVAIVYTILMQLIALILLLVLLTRSH